jgi:hypothetical protein
MPVTRNFGPLDQIKLTDKQLMKEVGLLVRERIVRRTRAGEGPDGPFKPYSAGYAAQKKKALGTGDVVDLTVSGGMVNAIVLTKIEDDEVELGFSS